jgi:MFS family permease
VALSSLRPLRHRRFALLWSASAVSNIGTWMQTVAVGAMVTEQTGQAQWTALVAVAAFLPIGVLAPVGGALADRLDRRRAMVIGNVAEAVLATLLAVLTAEGNASPGVVTLIVFGNGCLAALILPFYQAMVPDLVPRDELLAASSLGSAQYNLGRVVGPALAAGLIAMTSFTWVFAVNAGSFFAVIAALVLMGPTTRPVAHDDGLGIVGRIVAGARVALAEPGCRAAMLLVATVSFLLAPFIALIPAKAHDLVGGGAKATASAAGILTTAQGIGAVAGALLVAPLALRYGRRRMAIAYLIATALLLMAYGGAPNLALATIALVAVGGAYIGILAGLNTVVQLRAPFEYRGRILSLFFMTLGSVYPVGALVQGAIADRVGLGVTTAGGAVLLLVVLAGIALARPDLLGALDDPEEVAHDVDERVGLLQGEKVGGVVDLDEAAALDL